MRYQDIFRDIRKQNSYLKDTFSNGLLKWDTYAKPEKLGSLKVPKYFFQEIIKKL